MPTAKTRVNISLSSATNSALKKLAIRDQVPTATKAERLLELALEIEEDEVWNQIAVQRGNTKGNFIPHNQAWK